jgi:hypothetical protein
LITDLQKGVLPSQAVPRQVAVAPITTGAQVFTVQVPWFVLGQRTPPAVATVPAPTFVELWNLPALAALVPAETEEQVPPSEGQKKPAVEAAAPEATSAEV